MLRKITTRFLSILLAILALPAPPAWAGEKYLGAIVSAAGADTSNDSTATPFLVPPKGKITLWCNAVAYVITDSNVAVTSAGGSNPGLYVAANAVFPTSVGAQVRITSSATAANGGGVVRIAGPGAVTCYVYARAGDE